MATQTLVVPNNRLPEKYRWGNTTSVLHQLPYFGNPQYVAAYLVGEPNRQLQAQPATQDAPAPKIPRLELVFENVSEGMAGVLHQLVFRLRAQQSHEPVYKTKEELLEYVLDNLN